MSWVLRRNEDGWYVAPPGSVNSYTRSLKNARKFATKAEAEREACGNEHPEEVR
ncbi:MAG TPA: hypothetical protein PLD10_13175 [Rhodopila sp.]|nr:hypothetical protein [Rhodopila sp.]